MRCTQPHPPRKRYEDPLEAGARVYDMFVRAFDVRPAVNKGKAMRITGCPLLIAKGFVLLSPGVIALVWIDSRTDLKAEVK